jgi:AraC-like DNA-binding protein
VRRETAEHYLRDTDISLSHLTRELGYAEQSVLTRSCRRWFGCGPSSYRNAVRSVPPSRPGQLAAPLDRVQSTTC